MLPTGCGAIKVVLPKLSNVTSSTTLSFPVSTVPANINQWYFKVRGADGVDYQANMESLVKMLSTSTFLDIQTPKQIGKSTVYPALTWFHLQSQKFDFSSNLTDMYTINLDYSPPNSSNTRKFAALLKNFCVPQDYELDDTDSVFDDQ